MIKIASYLVYEIVTPCHESLYIILDICWRAIFQEIYSQYSFLRNREIVGDNIHPKRVPHEWDLNWAKRLDEAACYTDNMQFIFPKYLRVWVYISGFNKVRFSACVDHENAFWE